MQFKISLSVAEVEKGAFQIGGQSLTNQEEKRASQKVNPNGLTELDLFYRSVRGLNSIDRKDGVQSWITHP